MDSNQQSGGYWRERGICMVVRGMAKRLENDSSGGFNMIAPVHDWGV
jgi:hypothetical protein